jgi:hypothetical protein
MEIPCHGIDNESSGYGKGSSKKQPLMRKKEVGNALLFDGANPRHRQDVLRRTLAWFRKYDTKGKKR